jgi:SAM-dependent methyltransferase
MTINEAQARFWNGPAAEGWVKGQAMLDGMFAPVAERIVETVTEAPARNVLDVGCGTGATTLAISRALGDSAACTGLDISEPMLALARARAKDAGATAQFIRADAQTHAFAPGQFDTIVSRFGIMFFDDPVAAFSNLRRACAPGGRLRCIAWRSMADNPFMTTAERAAAPLLPDMPAREEDVPGQFGLADADRTRRILADSGWTGIAFVPVDFACTMPAAAIDGFLIQRGPVGAALQDVDDATRARVIETARAAFAPYVHGDEVRFNAACWMIRAQA